MIKPTAEMLRVGKISGVFGVKGWVKVYSFTEPKENIVKYSPWYLKLDQQWQVVEVKQGRGHGKTVIACLDGVDTREHAEALKGVTISIARKQLAELTHGEYYWSDLMGLKVLTIDKFELGQVSHLIETGANDVLVVKGERERLIPFLPPEVIRHVDLAEKTIIVDWDPDF